jgi:hypothetical protein
VPAVLSPFQFHHHEIAIRIEAQQVDTPPDVFEAAKLLGNDVEV